MKRCYCVLGAAPCRPIGRFGFPWAFPPPCSLRSAQCVHLNRANFFMDETGGFEKLACVYLVFQSEYENRSWSSLPFFFSRGRKVLIFTYVPLSYGIPLPNYRRLILPKFLDWKLQSGLLNSPLNFCICHMSRADPESPHLPFMDDAKVLKN